jgi:hypothetical protein
MESSSHLAKKKTRKNSQISTTNLQKTIKKTTKNRTKPTKNTQNIFNKPSKNTRKPAKNLYKTLIYKE